MKVIIDNGVTKRELHAPFTICASTEDLKRLRDAIDYGLGRADVNGATYGWLVEVHPRVNPLTNTPPKSWSEM